LPAIGAFVLTVLLAVGGTAASALWQQSATATMSVTANGTWQDLASGGITLTCGSSGNVNSYDKKNPAIAVHAPAGSVRPTSLTYGAVSNGILVPYVTGVGPLADPPVVGSIVLNQLMFAGKSSGQQVAVHVTAIYSDLSMATAVITLTIGSGNSGVNCG
jgi:hypothetical protein